MTMLAATLLWLCLIGWAALCTMLCTALGVLWQDWRDRREGT